MTCSHLACRCQETLVIKDGHPFCSEACAAATPSTTGCGCGHAECMPKERPEPPSDGGMPDPRPGVSHDHGARPFPEPGPA